MSKREEVNLLDEFALRLVNVGIDRAAFASDAAAVATATGRLQEDVSMADVVAFRAYNMAETMLKEKYRREIVAARPLLDRASPTAPAAPPPADPYRVRLVPMEELEEKLEPSLAPDTPIGNLGIPYSILRLLCGAGFRTSGQLLRATEDEIGEISGIGHVKLAQLVAHLATRNLRLATTSTGIWHELEQS